MVSLSDARFSACVYTLELAKLVDADTLNEAAARDMFVSMRTVATMLIDAILEANPQPSPALAPDEEEDKPPVYFVQGDEAVGRAITPGREQAAGERFARMLDDLAERVAAGVTDEDAVETLNESVISLAREAIDAHCATIELQKEVIAELRAELNHCRLRLVNTSS